MAARHQINMCTSLFIITAYQKLIFTAVRFLACLSAMELVGFIKEPIKKHITVH